MASVQTSVRKEAAVLGQPLKRVEDMKFITGTGSFTDDVVLPHMLHGWFVRSLHAHARIKEVDVSEAVSLPGVRLVLAGRDLVKKINSMPTLEGWGETKATDRPVLAVQEANFAGEPIALVVAEDPYTAEDAAELVKITYDPLPAVVDPVKAAQPGSPKVHDYLKDNIGYRSTKSFGSISKAFKAADHVVKFEQEFPRLSAVPMEPRAEIASYDEASQVLTVWLSSQDPYGAKEDFASTLKLPENRVRVISPDTGGGFGQKGSIGPENVAVCYASMVLGKPVKWIDGRRDNLMASTHGRGQKHFIEAAVRKDGKILGLKVKVVCDGGAYSDWAFTMPETTVGMGPGVYDIGAYEAEAITTFTNKPPIGAYRGAGRPEATYLIERTVDVLARRLKLDPVKVRQKNYVPKRKFPYSSAGGHTYDSGNYEMNLQKALEYSDYDRLKAFQREARAKGRLVGLGVITYVEVCGFGPGFPQTASVAVSKQGSVTVTVGTNPQGQGHATAFAQIVAEELGLDVNDVVVQYGDTSALPWGTITAGSRSAVVGGSAVLLATRKVKEKMSKIAAKMLGLKSDRMNFKNGKITPASSSSKSLAFKDVADKAYSLRSLPPGMEATLFEYCAFAPPGNAFPFGTHVAMVEVDRETGMLKILKYVAVDDVGKVINPLIVEGQVHGGVLQGIAQALLEQVVFDENGQNLTSTLSDYLIPSIDSAPMIESYRTETPSPLNPLGVKGVGEAGTIGATPVIVNAVEDALSPFGVEIQKLPLTPEYVHSLTKGKLAPKRLKIPAD
ncbi:MAG: xanthine dehydrogenase family protein molybdopterin-binding subunit [Nitrososphaerales archaeon]|nr:xanthine dehydrogenase family protein molybdopterin-binding subunit [Nitrososphaerales archaeon]